MGVFGFTCAKTNIPVLACDKEGVEPTLAAIVVYAPDGQLLEGLWDGCGRLVLTQDPQFDSTVEGVTARLLRHMREHNDQAVGMVNLMHWWREEHPAFKAVLKAFFSPQDTFATLTQSYADPAQGYWISPYEVRLMHGRERSQDSRRFRLAVQYFRWYQNYARGEN